MGKITMYCLDYMQMMKWLTFMSRGQIKWVSFMDGNGPRKAALSRISGVHIEIQKEDCLYQNTYHNIVKATDTWVENLIHSFQFTLT